MVMNIFVTDANPIIAARNLCDVHVNKMVLESAQMLANCFSSEQLAHAPKAKTGAIRKHSYFNHPCSKWVRASTENMRWLALHAEAMEEERLARGFNPHFCAEFNVWALNNVMKSQVPWGTETDFAVAISPDSKCRQVVGFEQLHPIQKYRLYYMLDKRELAGKLVTWRRNRPDWLDWSIEQIKNENCDSKFKDYAFVKQRMATY